MARRGNRTRRHQSPDRGLQLADQAGRAAGSPGSARSRLPARQAMLPIEDRLTACPDPATATWRTPRRPPSSQRLIKMPPVCVAPDLNAALRAANRPARWLASLGPPAHVPQKTPDVVRSTPPRAAPTPDRFPPPSSPTAELGPLRFPLHSVRSDRPLHATARHFPQSRSATPSARRGTDARFTSARRPAPSAARVPISPRFQSSLHPLQPPLRSAVATAPEPETFQHTGCTCGANGQGQNTRKHPRNQCFPR